MNQVESKIRLLAQKIIDNKIDLVEGCRKIAHLSHLLNNYDNNILEKHLLFIRGVSSESDRFPIGKVRKTCSPEHSAELDLDQEKFIAFSRSQVLDSCTNIIQLI